MNKTTAICAIMCWATLWLAVVICHPSLLSDKNTFLHNFVNHEFLSFMGVVVTITLASAGNLFIELNKLDKQAGESIFSKSKRDVKHSAFSLLWALVASLALVTVKPLLDSGDQTMALANGLAISIILFSVLVLTDLTMAAFKLDVND